jgi:tetratricopeptide (TPR) repeat protein
MSLNIRKKAYELRMQAFQFATQDDARCIDVYIESYNLSMSIQDYPSAGVTALNIGRAYVIMLKIRDFVQANRWYQRSLELFELDDFLWRARALSHLGDLEFYLLQDATIDFSKRNQEDHFLKAENYLREALRLFPTSELEELANTHSTLAAIYGEVGDLDKARYQAELGIKYYEETGNYINIANTQYNLAKGLANGGYHSEAREYALAALYIYKTFCPDFTSGIKQTEDAIKIIEHSLNNL